MRELTSITNAVLTRLFNKGINDLTTEEYVMLSKGINKQVSWTHYHPITLELRGLEDDDLQSFAMNACRFFKEEKFDSQDWLSKRLGKKNYQWVEKNYPFEIWRYKNSLASKHHARMSVESFMRDIMELENKKTECNFSWLVRGRVYTSDNHLSYNRKEYGQYYWNWVV